MTTVTVIARPKAPIDVTTLIVQSVGQSGQAAVVVASNPTVGNKAPAIISSDDSIVRGDRTSLVLAQHFASDLNHPRRSSSVSVDQNAP